MIKSKDVSLFLVVVGFASLVAFLLASVIFKPSSVKTSVEVVQPISSEFPALPESVYNENALNPTQVITIGGEDNGNQVPFQAGP